MTEEESEKKKRLNLKGWWWKLPLLIIALVWFASTMGFFGKAGLPKCKSSNATKTLTQAFDQSQFARNLNLSVVQVSAQNEVAGSTEKQRNCQAKITMNNGNVAAVDYKMLLQKNGQFMLEFKVRQ